MKRSCEEELFNNADQPKNKKQKIDLTVFSHLPAEILVHHIVPLIARDWLYLNLEWYKIARVCLTSDQRVRFTRNSLMAVVANNDIIGVKLHIDSHKLSAKDLCEAFVFACSNSYKQIVDLLLAQPQVDPHYGSDVAINNAAIRGDYHLIKRFVKGKHVDPNNFSPVLLAVKNKHYSIVKLLLKDKTIDPSTDKNSALIHAATKGHYKIVKLLLKDPRVDPSAQHNQAIRRASRISYKITKLLMKDPRVDPSAKSNHALKMAVGLERYKTVKLLMKDPRVNPSDTTREYSPLARAVSHDYRILKHLLKDPRSDPTVSNHTMIRAAVRHDKREVVKLLLQHPRTDPIGPGGYESEILEDNCATTIDIAVGTDNLDMLQLLLADPRVDFTFWSGYAIHRLVMLGRYTTAHILLSDPRVVISKELFEGISRTMQQYYTRAALFPDFLDLLQLKRESDD